MPDHLPDHLPDQQPDQRPQQSSGATPNAPVLPGVPTVKKTERPHPLTPIIRGWIVFVAIALGLFRESFNGGDDGGGLLSLGIRWLLLIIIGIVALAALAGFVSWYFTKFVIDDEELRVETGALFRNSRKVAFDRVQSVDLVQPLAARMFGLAELRIEAGAGDRGIRLRYLKRSKANQLRDYLLARAHGEQATVAASADRQSSAFTDATAGEHTLVTVAPQMLIFGFLLSSEWLVTLLLVIIAFGVTTFFGVTLYALPGLIPLAFGGLSLISRRVFAQFNYTLAESVRGLRITRGLTNLTSQSLPLNRIQGIKISQSLLWKPFGWYRVDVDILGYGSSSENQENKSDASSILLPIATAAQTRTALSRVLPGFELDAVTLVPSPTRARAIRPLDAWTFRYGWDEHVVVSRAGVLVNETSVVPHSKAQSVRIEQGPLQRLLRLANVHVDTPKGPVRLVARHIDPVAAREFALTELDRARAARARDRAVPTRPARPESDDRAVLDRFGIGPDRYLGGGGESRVYALDGQRVLRIYLAGHESSRTMIEQLRPAYQHWAGQLGRRQPPIMPPLELPMIIDAGEIDGRVFSIDRRMSGQSFSGWLRTAPEQHRRAALLSYLDTAWLMQELELPTTGFARLFGDQPQTFASLPALIHDQLFRTLHRLDHAAFPEAEAWARQVVDEVSERRCQPRLVHGDYFPGNTYVRTEPDGRPVVRGVGDFSPHTLAADPLMDIAGAAILMELEAYDGAATDARWLADVIRDRIGADEFRWFGVYRRYYSVYFGDDPTVLAWSRAQLAGR